MRKSRRTGSQGPLTGRSSFSLTSADGIALMVAEYQSLRAEIVTLIGLQSQLQALAVIGFGTVLSVGFQSDKAVIVLIYPLLSAILGVSWLNHAQSVSRIAAYIAEQVERSAGQGYMGWENYVRTAPLTYGRLGYWGVRSIFPGSSVLAIIAGSAIAKHSLGETVVFISSAVVTVATVVVVLLWREDALVSDFRQSTATAAFSPPPLPVEEESAPVGNAGPAA